MHPDPDTKLASAVRILPAAALLVAVLASPCLARTAAAMVPAAQPLAAQTAPSDGARAVIQDTADKVIALLKDPTLDSHARRERIVDIVDNRLDMMVVSKLVLAKNYGKFTTEEQAEFRKQFREHLIATYYRNAEGAKFSTIEIYDSRDEGKGDWTVRSKVISKEQGDTLIDYRLRANKDTGAWQIIDITIENVSLVQNFRSQFQEVLSGKSPAQLIELLREKNAKASVEDRATDKASDASGGEEQPAKPRAADGSDGVGGNSVTGGVAPAAGDAEKAAAPR